MGDMSQENMVRGRLQAFAAWPSGINICEGSTSLELKLNKLCKRPLQYVPAPVTLTFDLLTLKMVSDSRVTWATSVPILVFQGFHRRTGHFFQGGGWKSFAQKIDCYVWRT